MVLSTHRQCDGDGLGAQLALLFALRKAGKQARILNVDGVPRKYHFLGTDRWVDVFEGAHNPLAPTDLALIFDTNDRRLLAPLYSELETKCAKILFVDHHPVLSKGPSPTAGSYVDISAASTGEITFDLIRALGIPLDAEIARALYTSVVFDTQLFRFIRNSPRSHEICAELLHFERHPEDVHRALFANHTIQKIAFLAKALDRIEYFAKGQLAFVKLHDKDLLEHGLDWDESRDVIDMIMNIETLEAAVLFREDGPEQFKLSLRSKGNVEVLSVAEAVGGGGHPYSSGAYLKGSYAELKKIILEKLTTAILNRAGARGSTTQA